MVLTIWILVYLISVTSDKDLPVVVSVYEEATTCLEALGTVYQMALDQSVDLADTLACRPYSIVLSKSRTQLNW